MFPYHFCAVRHQCEFYNQPQLKTFPIRSFSQKTTSQFNSFQQAHLPQYPPPLFHKQHPLIGQFQSQWPEWASGNRRHPSISRQQNVIPIEGMVWENKWDSRGRPHKRPISPFNYHENGPLGRAIVRSPELVALSWAIRLAVKEPYF